MITVTLVHAAAPRETHEQTMELPEGTTAREAVAGSRMVGPWESLTPGVWGRPIEWSQVLREGDRLELCRPLTVDPKVARRERFQRQGARGTGLFTRRRDGGKAGY